MTLIELLVAMSIFVILGGTLVMFLRVGLETWRVGEIRRETFERSQAILDQVEADLGSCFTDPRFGPGGRVEVRFVSDFDGRGAQRLRFVRTLDGEMRHTITQQAGNLTGGFTDYDYIDDALEMEQGILRATGGLQEVAYLLDPDPTRELLWRGVKSPIGGESSLFIDENLYSWDEGAPVRPRRARPLAAGVLYVEFGYWGQETERWTGEDDEGRARSWWDSSGGVREARVRGLDGAGLRDEMAARNARDDVFPSRVRVILVLRPARATRLARLSVDVGEGDDRIAVDRADGYPEGAFPFIRIDEEWIRYESLSAGEFVGCTRGARGTAAAAHERGTEVLYGSTFCRVIRIPTGRTSAWREGR